MHSIRAGRAGLLAALSAAILSTAAVAADTLRDETTLLVRTSAGAVERLTYAGELADGERRGLTTEGGNPATLSRSGAGMLLELAGERFEVKLPQVEVAADGEVEVGDAPGQRRIVIHKHEDHATTGDADATTTETRKVVKVIRHGDVEGAAAGDGAGEGAAIALALAGDEPELMLLEGEGPKVIVMRRIVRGKTTP